ncbi:MAG: TolC family protein [Gammaproteobacteria bacterium]
MAAALSCGALSALSFVALADPTDLRLTLAEVDRLALSDQPILASGAANIRALRDQSLAAAQLPDPRLIAGVMQMPVNGGEALSFRDDDFTALSVGVAQEFPRAAKRRLRAAALDQEADGTRLALTELERRIQLNAGSAYLDVVAAAAGAQILERLTAEAERQQAAANINFVAGRSGQPELLAATVDAALTADRGRALRQREQAGRAALARWIGPAAERQVDASLDLPVAPPLAGLLDELPRHPWLAAPATKEKLAATDLQLARAALKPDWRMEIRYDHRLEFPDLVTVMVGIDLPLFPGNRQNRSSAAANARLSAASTEREDRLREATASLMGAYREWQAGRGRLVYYDESVLPPARDRVEATLLAYRSGSGALAGFLDARRSLMEAELMRLDLYVQVARARLQIRYFDTEPELATETEQ